MNIALIGFGKMGRAIEEIALDRGHNIVCKITAANSHLLEALDPTTVDVAIDFTAPSVARHNAFTCLRNGVTVVSGTTGWEYTNGEVADLIGARQIAFLHATNFSIGVNLFFEMNKLLAKLMAPQLEYSPAIEETHHIHKKDAPSGTAITLAHQIMESNKRLNTWSLNFMNNPAILPVVAHRVDDVPGTHIVRYDSDIDTIELKHTAHNRRGFANGAVLAAEFIAGKTGVFTMKDVLGI